MAYDDALAKFTEDGDRADSQDTTIRSLQRELAEARAERDKWRAEFRNYAYDDGVVVFRPTDELLIAAATNPAPGPSDANLIAAAPDLLAACEMALTLVPRFAPGGLGEIGVGQIKAAIVKAKGGAA